MDDIILAVNGSIKTSSQVREDIANIVLALNPFIKMGKDFLEKDFSANINYESFNKMQKSLNKMLQNIKQE
jgi:hypothetical protein